jgi:hypothetical protein
MKRSSQVALLLMGTVAVGGGAFALMPSENCPPNQSGVTQPGGQPNQNCNRSWRSSGGGGGGHVYSGGYSGGSSSSSSSHLSSQQHFSGSGTSSGGSSSTSPSGGVARGGFGSFSSHFSGGG